MITTSNIITKTSSDLINFKRNIKGKQLKEYKKSLVLTNFQREILIGLLLGDAHLETRNNGVTYRLNIGQSIKHQEYIYHLFDIFYDFCGKSPRSYTYCDSEYSYLQFTTYSHMCFRFYGQQFYSDINDKKVPKLIHRWLTPQNLAYWYMDDGSIKGKNNKGVYFNTQGFSYKDTSRLSNILKSKFDLSTKLKLDKSVSNELLSLSKGHQIYVSAKSHSKLKDLISPYLLESMKYKFPN